jgi:hypothetical protein
VVFHDKPIGNGFLLQGAAGKLEGTVANAAMKMMVVRPSGAFVQSSERWIGDPFQPPVIDKKPEIPIDRCLVERRYALAAML